MQSLIMALKVGADLARHTVDELFLIFRDKDGLSPEWALIELQGDLKSRSESNLEDQFIGDLHFTKSGTPILIIGHYLLFGKEMMEKPLALLEKKASPDCETEYLVKTIITRKILFKTRPRPIVGKC